MLSKVSYDTYYTTPVVDTEHTVRSEISPGGGAYNTLCGFSTPIGGFLYKYNFKFNYSSYDGYSSGSLLQTKIDGAGDYITLATLQSSGSVDINIEGYNSIYLYYYNSKNFGYSFYTTNSIITRQIGFKKDANKMFPIGYPREVKRIGNKARTTIFGVNIDNTRLKDTPASYGEFVKFCNKLGNKQTITAPHNTTYTATKYGILRGNYTSGTNVQVKINDLEIFNGSLTSANQITIPPITIAPGDTVFVYGNGTNNCKIDLFG